jgi:hypothetical protein
MKRTNKYLVYFEYQGAEFKCFCNIQHIDENTDPQAIYETLVNVAQKDLSSKNNVVIEREHIDVYNIVVLDSFTETTKPSEEISVK